ncbi:MAG TPA: radical SAM protein [bacterium]|nr:radical SAM protein [bacterium]
MKANNYVSVQSMPDFSLWKKLGDRRTLFSFELELTSRCNLDCRHCYINLPAADKKAKSTELSVEQISRIAGEAVELGAIWCLLTGGEPLLRKDFFDIFLALKEKGLLVSVFTNATLINSRHIEFFKKYPPRDIEITVYGVTAETYERITRRKGSYRALRLSLDKLISAGIPFTLKAMALKSNYQEMAEIGRFCRAHNNPDYRFDPFLHLRYDNDPFRNQEIKSERLSPEEIVALEKSEPLRIEGLKQAKMFPLDPDANKPTTCHLFGCGIGKENFCVTSDGRFTFCSTLRHPEFLYDLKTGNLADGWKGLYPKVRQLSSQRQEYIENCAFCPIINLCRWCPATAHLETGSLDLPIDHFCQVAHLREKYLLSDKSTTTSNLKI